MPIEFRDNKIVPKAPRLTRRNTLVLLGSATAAAVLACGTMEATLPDGTGIPTVVPTSGPEKEPQPIKYATWVEIGMDEQAKFTDSLPADRPRFLKGGSSELAGFRLDNGVQDPIVTKFIMYEINPDDSFEIVDAQGNRANQNAVIYIQEYDGYGNVKLKKLYGVSYATIDTNTGKTVGTSTIWSEVADSKIDTANKTVDLTGAKPVLIINSDQSDTKMYFRPLMPKNMLVGLPSNIDEVALPVMFPGSAFKMVGVEATAQPEVAKLPDTLDQMYKDQIEKFGFKHKFDKDGNILVNFGTGSRFLSSERDSEGFVLAFKKTSSGYETISFVHDLGSLDPNILADVDKIAKYSKTNGVDVLRKNNEGNLSIMAVSTGIFTEEKAHDNRPGKPDINTTYHLFNTANSDGKIVTIKVLYCAYNSDGESTSIVVNPGKTIKDMKLRFLKNDLKILNMPIDLKQLIHSVPIGNQFFTTERLAKYGEILKSQVIPDGLTCYTISAEDL